MKKILFLTVALFAALSANASVAHAKRPNPTPGLLKRGSEVYAQNCAACHGMKGDGRGPAGAGLPQAPRNFTGAEKFKKGESVEEIFDVVTKGMPQTMMVAFGHLSVVDRWAVSYYLKKFKKN